MPVFQRSAKIDFLAVGPQKTATTWLHRALAHHPAIALPVEKETHFFDWYFEDKGIDWFWWHFKDFDPKQLHGEVGPSYFHQPDVLERIRTLYPECKIIVSVRNPVRRAFSLFRHHLAKNRVRPDFWKAVETIPEIFESGRFDRYIPMWEDAFRAERVRFVVQEDIESSPENVIRNLYQFLGIRSDSLPPNLNSRDHEMRAPISPVLGGVAHKIASALRGWRLYGVVDFVRRHGGESVLRGGEKRMPQLTPELYAQILEQVTGQIDYLERRLDRDFRLWRTFAPVLASTEKLS